MALTVIRVTFDQFSDPAAASQFIMNLGGEVKITQTPNQHRNPKPPDINDPEGWWSGSSGRVPT
jgi:hypothetical protein